MTAIWLGSFLLVTITGLGIMHFRDIAKIDVAGRIAIAFTCGLVVVALLMFGISAAGLRWSFWTLGVPLAVVAAGSIWLARKKEREETTPWSRTPAIAFTAVALVGLYGAGTARMTTADLLLFWGPKAIHFFHQRAIDVEFLRFPHHYLMHPDYPLLVPLTWVASSMVAGDFSNWGAAWGAAF